MSHNPLVAGKINVSKRMKNSVITFYNAKCLPVLQMTTFEASLDTSFED